jgi:hypothetical protein
MPLRWIHPESDCWWLVDWPSMRKRGFWKENSDGYAPNWGTFLDAFVDFENGVPMI